MKNQNTATQLMDIAMRIRELREILGYSIQSMAEQAEVSEEMYRLYESGTVDLPFTFMHKCAKVFGVEITVLLEGHSAKLSGYTVTRKGRGLVTASEDGITIQDMAPMFRKKLATPYWVTYAYSEDLQDRAKNNTLFTFVLNHDIVKARCVINCRSDLTTVRACSSKIFKHSFHENLGIWIIS